MNLKPLVKLAETKKTTFLSLGKKKMAFVTMDNDF
jgi:hypothetical protein